jgi:hypothetical protein
MCNIAVLFTNPQSPSDIRVALKGHQPKFFQTDSKGILEQIKKIMPRFVALDATCPKKSKRLINQLPEGVEVLYVGGTEQQQKQMNLYNCQPSWKSVLKTIQLQ